MEVYSIKVDNIGKAEAPGFPSIIDIYQKSIIDWDDLYQSITVMEVKTSNNTETINRMPFHVFTTKIKYLNKYIEAENKQSEGGEEAPDANSAFADTQKQAKSLMKNSINPGNLKMPKISK